MACEIPDSRSYLDIAAVHNCWNCTVVWCRLEIIRCGTSGSEESPPIGSITTSEILTKLTVEVFSSKSLSGNLILGSLDSSTGINLGGVHGCLFSIGNSPSSISNAEIVFSNLNGVLGKSVGFGLLSLQCGIIISRLD